MDQETIAKTNIPIRLLAEQGILGQNSFEDSLKVGYLDSTGKLYIPFQFDQALDFEDSTARAQWGGGWGIITTSGKWSIKPIYEDLGPLSQGIRKYLSQGKWGYIDLSGNTIQNAIYSKAGSFNNHLAPVCFGTHCVYIKENGTIAWQANYSEAGEFYQGKAWVKTNSYWLLIDTTGKIVSPEQWELVKPYQESYATVKRGGLWGLVNLNGKSILKPQYSDLKDFKEGLIGVKQGELWGYMNIQGAWVINPKFIDLGNFHEGYAWAKTQHGIGLISKNGQWALKPEFDAIEDRKQGFCKAWKYINDTTLEWRIYNSSWQIIAKAELKQRLSSPDSSFTQETISDSITATAESDNSFLQLGTNTQFQTLRTLKFKPLIQKRNTATADQEEELSPEKSSDSLDEIPNSTEDQFY